MEFIVKAQNGSKPIEEFLKEEIEQHAKRKFGITVDVEIKMADSNKKYKERKEA